MILKNNKTYGEWKIQLSIHINLISSKVQEKLALFMHGVITQNLWWVIKQTMLLTNFFNLF